MKKLGRRQMVTGVGPNMSTGRRQTTTMTTKVECKTRLLRYPTRGRDILANFMLNGAADFLLLERLLHAKCIRFQRYRLEFKGFQHKSFNYSLAGLLVLLEQPSDWSDHNHRVRPK